MREDFLRKWIKVQQKYDYPVTALGVRIESSDEAAMSMWLDYGIDVDGRCAESGGLHAIEALSYSSGPAGAEQAQPVIMYRGVRVE